jgi:hypothetical protein
LAAPKSQTFGGTNDTLIQITLFAINHTQEKRNTGRKEGNKKRKGIFIIYRDKEGNTRDRLPTSLSFIHSLTLKRRRTLSDYSQMA